VNIPRSSPMEGEHTPTIIQLIRSTNLAVIQFQDSHIYILHIPTIPYNEWRFKEKKALSVSLFSFSIIPIIRARRNTRWFNHNGIEWTCTKK